MNIVRSTGSGVMSETITFSDNTQLDRIELHLGAASATAENFTVDLDCIGGAAYDVNINTQDMNTIQDLIIQPTRGYDYITGDKLVFAWANTNTETWGMSVYLRDL